MKEFETIIEYVFRHMISKELATDFLRNLGIENRKSNTYEKISKLALQHSQLFDINQIREFLIDKYEFTPFDFHFKNLSSGELQGHSWHGARPSTLHLSMQEKVREFIRQENSLHSLINVGADIMKHEYFMVATHDLLVDSLISHFKTEVIPPVCHKSVSDFIFRNIPYDLKNTGYPMGWDVNRPDNELALNLFMGADVDRLRKQAYNSLNGWGLNRFYVIIENQDRWVRDPQALISDFITGVKSLGFPMKFDFEGFQIFTLILKL